MTMLTDATQWEGATPEAFGGRSALERIYDRHDYFAERAAALGAWASLLAKVEQGMVPAAPAKAPRPARSRRAPA